jgi:hypothetical protein
MAGISPRRRKEAKQQIQLWLDMGWPRWRINNGCIEQLDIDPECADGLIREIRHEQQQALAVDRHEFMAQQLTRLEALAVRAQDEGNLGVALGAFKEMHALIGLHAQR